MRQHPAHMIARLLTHAAFALAAGCTLTAQTPLSLQDAVSQGLAKHPSIAAGQAAIDAAEARIDQARGGRMPKLNYTESYQRSNNPVFVFSSLLTQHQFGVQNFNIGPLNRPDALNNFQSTVVADQVLFDARRTSHAIRSAEIDRSMNEEQKRHAEMTLIATVAKAYYDVLAAEATLAVAQQSVRSAEADLKRARDVRAAGMSTDADVLSIEVHLASMREQQIRRGYDVQLSRSALNEAIGAALDAPVALSGRLVAANPPTVALGDMESGAGRERSEARQAEMSLNLAHTRSEAARSAFLPEIGFRAAFEADRQRFVDRGGANWLTAFTLRWNIFNGLEDRAREREASYAIQQAQARQHQVASAIRLDVRRAYFDLQAANERINVAEAAVKMAEESLRITKNRYESGLTNVTDLLRNEVAVLDSNNRLLWAIHDQRIAFVGLELAAGTLSRSSAALQ